MIWKRHLTLDELNATSDNTMVAHLGIVYTRLGDDVLEAEMPVDTRTHQPFGLLHGGASAALAETLGSMAGFMMTRDARRVNRQHIFGDIQPIKTVSDQIDTDRRHHNPQRVDLFPTI